MDGSTAAGTALRRDRRTAVVSEVLRRGRRTAAVSDCWYRRTAAVSEALRRDRRTVPMFRARGDGPLAPDVNHNPR